jgi:hypothetical protein
MIKNYYRYKIVLSKFQNEKLVFKLEPMQQILLAQL